MDIAMIHYVFLFVILLEYACICSIKCVDVKVCFSPFLRACLPHDIECSLDVPVRHILAFYLAAHYHVWIMCLLSQYQTGTQSNQLLSLSFIYLLIVLPSDWHVTCSMSSAYVHRCMTRRVHPFLFLHVGAVLFSNICERFHGSRFIWVLQSQFSLCSQSLLCI